MISYLHPKDVILGVEHKHILLALAAVESFRSNRPTYSSVSRKPRKNHPSIAINWVSLFCLGRGSRSNLVVSRALIILRVPLPHPPLLPLRFCLCFPITLFKVSKFSPLLSLIHCSQPCFQHLLSYISAEEKLPHPHRSNNSFILITLVDVRPHSSIQDVILQPFQCFSRIGLWGFAKMSPFRRVDPGNADMNLGMGMSSANILGRLDNNLPFCPLSPSFSLVFCVLATIPNLQAFHPAGGKDGSYLHRQLLKLCQTSSSS